MLLRLPYLALTSVFTLIRLLSMSDRDKDAEILALRHQLAVLQRQTDEPKLPWPDRALLAALLHHFPRTHLRQLQLIVSPDTLLRWHRDLLRRRHAKASRPKRPGRPRTVRSVHALVLRLADANRNWGYRRIHGELATLSIKVAASTVWGILKEHGIDQISPVCQLSSVVLRHRQAVTVGTPSSLNAGSSTHDRNSSGTESTTPCHTPSSA